MATDFISRDAALAALDEAVEISGYEYVKIENGIINIPAADVSPVVRGKWISDGAGYHWTYNCSICGWKDGYPFNERHHYCPNCGANMREDIGGDEDG